MRVKVLRVSGMPHGVDVWVDRTPRRCTYYVDERLITAEGAELLAAAATINVNALLAPRRGATG
jgi:hypothetical protein